MDKFDFQGYWWLPDDPDNQVFGTLYFDPDEGTRLDLFGSFRKAEDAIAFLESEPKPELILGLSSKGTPITLQNWKVITLSGTISVGGFITSSLEADTVFVGDHFQSSADIGFERLTVEYLHLDTWAGAYAFDMDMRPLRVKYEPIEPLTATVGDKYEVALSFPVNVTESQDQATKIAFTQRSMFTITFPEKTHFHHLTTIAFRLQHLLSLGTRESIHPLNMWGEMGSGKESKRVEINYRSIGRRGSGKKSLRPNKMLFGLRDLPEGFEPAVRRWLERAEELDTVYQLYFSNRYAPSIYLEQRFLNLIQALEVYHRSAMTPSSEPPEEHKKRIRKILQSVPEQHRDWLAKELEHSHEPRLIQRLKEIIRKLRTSAHPVTGANSRKRDKFVFKATRTRNYLTHFTESHEGEAAEGWELLQITQKLDCLVEICLLWELGFDEKKIVELVVGTGR